MAQEDNCSVVLAFNRHIGIASLEGRLPQDKILGNIPDKQLRESFFIFFPFFAYGSGNRPDP